MLNTSPTGHVGQKVSAAAERKRCARPAAAAQLLRVEQVGLQNIAEELEVAQ